MCCIEHDRLARFILADIPGLIEGAADGAGLGHRFLKHLQRTGLLLHIVDLAPFDPDTDPVAEARATTTSAHLESAARGLRTAGAVLMALLVSLWGLKETKGGEWAR